MELYIDGQRVDLYDDETINLNQSVKVLSDVQSVFTGYTNTFTIPASPTNNRVLNHYYRTDLNDSISALVRIPSFINIDGVPFKNGSVKIEGAKVSNGIAEYYKVTFIENLGILNSILGNNSLQTLDLSDYNYDYDDTRTLQGFGDVDTGATIGLFNGDIIYPLASPKRVWIYDDGDTGQNHTPNNIAYHSGHSGANKHGLNWYELKPAIKASVLKSKIESKYGLTFSGSFWSSKNWTDLYLWLHNSEGYMYQDNASRASVSKTSPLATVSQAARPFRYNPLSNNLEFTFSPTKYSKATQLQAQFVFGALSDDLKIEVFINGQLHKSQLVTTTGTTIIDIGNIPYSFFGSFVSFQFSTVNASSTFTYGLTIKGFDESGAYKSFVVANYGSQSILTKVVPSNLLPDISILDWINGLVKMFNLIVTSKDGITYEFEPYNDFYSAGKEINLDRWIDNKEVEISPIPAYKQLRFEYEKGTGFQQAQFRELNGRGYGDLVQVFNFDEGDSLEVKVPFVQPYFTQMINQNDDSQTNLPAFFSCKFSTDGSSDGEVGSSVYDAPVHFYLGGTLDISSNPINFIDSANNETQINLINYCNVANEKVVPNSVSTNFSEDFVEFLADRPELNLYSQFWKGYLGDVYDSNTRILSLKGFINRGVFINLKMNDTILIGNRRHRIESLSTEMISGESKLILRTL